MPVYSLRNVSIVFYTQFVDYECLFACYVKHCISIIHFFTLSDLLGLATRSSLEHSTGRPRGMSPHPTHLTFYISFFCSLISRCALFLWAAKIIPRRYVWISINLKCRMWFVSTINRQTSTLNHRMTNVRPKYTNTTPIEVSSRYKRVHFTMGFLKRICVVTRGLPVWSLWTSLLINCLKQQRNWVR